MIKKKNMRLKREMRREHEQNTTCDVQIIKAVGHSEAEFQTGNPIARQTKRLSIICFAAQGLSNHYANIVIDRKTGRGFRLW